MLYWSDLLLYTAQHAPPAGSLLVKQAVVVKQMNVSNSDNAASLVKQENVSDLVL